MIRAESSVARRPLRSAFVLVLALVNGNCTCSESENQKKAQPENQKPVTVHTPDGGHTFIRRTPVLMVDAASPN
jgi:hypothetical protein